MTTAGSAEGGEETRRSAHGAANHARLEEIRAAVDPDGLFEPLPNQPK